MSAVMRDIRSVSVRLTEAYEADRLAEAAVWCESRAVVLSTERTWPIQMIEAEANVPLATFSTDQLSTFLDRDRDLKNRQKS